MEEKLEMDICVLVDPVSKRTKYVKAKNLVIADDLTIGQLINQVKTLQEENEKLKDCMSKVLKMVEYINSNTELLKVEVL